MIIINAKIVNYGGFDMLYGKDTDSLSILLIQNLQFPPIMERSQKY